jgi:hypothetical protein
MGTKDVFKGAKAAYTMFDAYINTVAQDIGMERAVGLLAKTYVNMGAMQGKRMKEQAGIKKFDAKAASPAVKTTGDALGVSTKVAEQSPQRVVFKIGRCSIYDAAQTLGMDTKTIETMCRASTERFMDTLVKQLDPSLSFRVRKFRSTADDFCEEEIILS